MKINITPKQKDYIKEFFLDLPSNLLKIYLYYNKFDKEIRIIGGAVRDLLLLQTPRDIDLATNALPTESLFILHELANDTKSENEIITAKGIRHGTVVITFSEFEQYEITSIDFDIVIQNNKIVTKTTQQWKEDAYSRDFTINTMSIDFKQNVYDYMNAYDDLMNQRIKFVTTNYQEAVINDPLLILRFFKLMAKFPKPQFDKEIIYFFRKNIELLSIIKPSTMEWFCTNISHSPYGEYVINLMNNIGINTDKYIKTIF